MLHRVLYKLIYWVWGCGNGVHCLLFTHCPPTHTPSPFSCTWEHTGSLHLIFAPPLHLHTAPFTWVVPCPVRTPFMPPPFASQVAPPIVLCPSPSLVDPL